jgi:hypothetical protein
MTVSVLSNMLSRAAHCRRLAGSLHNEEARQSLLKMADEIEADAARLGLEAGSAHEGATRTTTARAAPDLVPRRKIEPGA